MPTLFLLLQYAGETPDPSGNPLFLLFVLATIVVTLASIWRLFDRAGEPGWAAIVPIYNTIVLLRVAGMSPWWLLLLLVPLVNVVVLLAVAIAVADRFGRGAGFGVGLWLAPFIFYPVLAFGDDRRVSPRIRVPTRAAS